MVTKGVAFIFIGELWKCIDLISLFSQNAELLFRMLHTVDIDSKTVKISDGGRFLKRTR